VADAVLDLTADVKRLYFQLLSIQIKYQWQKLLLETYEAESLVALDQKSVGNISELQSAKHQTGYVEAKVDLANTEKELIRIKESLNRLMGLCDCETDWCLSVIFPAFPFCDDTLENLQEIAFWERLDLEAARVETDKIAQTLGLYQWWAYTNPALAISTERDSDKSIVTGPEVTLELPLFNYGQADRRRLMAKFRQSLKRYQQLAIDTESEVREHYLLMALARQIVERYQNEILPLRQHILKMSHKHYNAMNVNVYDLLLAKREEIQDQIDLAMQFGDYWINRSKLERAIGRDL
jgi:cobalt-zinc-cadmium efflux system outer membrane protein